MKIEDSYPLSAMQNGMLVHSLSAPQSGVYIQQLVAVLREELDISAFQRAWDQVLRRHVALRTSFSWQGSEQPIQRVQRNVVVPLQHSDWRDRAPGDQEKQLESFLQTDRQLGFELDQAPLMRLTLLRCARAEYRLIWTSHHALFDGRSRVLLLNEVFAFYEAICRGDDLSLSDPSPYRSYIDWLQQQNFSKAENFWRARLQALDAGEGLAVNHRQPKPPSVQSYGMKAARLSKSDTRALRSFVEQHQLTANTMLQGAWALLLSRYSGKDNIVFGATRAGRHAAFAGADAVVGLLINTVPVPVHVNPKGRLLPFLQSLRSQWIAMRDYEHTPLVKIHEWSPLPPASPLFDNLLVFENYQLNALLRAQGGRWKQREFHLRGTTHFPLTVAGYLGPDLTLEITYDRQSFDDGTIARMLSHLRTLLLEMIRDPDRQLLDIPMLSSTERHQLLVEWNATERDYPGDKCVHELIEAQAKRTPDAIAIVFEDQQLTYRELDVHANQLAHRLQVLGVGHGALVGICVERSLQMVVGLLAILKAGGAYVPLDPTYPKERLAFMLDDPVSVLLTQRGLLDLLPDHKARVVCLDTDWELMVREHCSKPVGDVTSESLAYVIFTSGSTGKPKGVEISHRAVVNFLHSMREEPGLTGQDTLISVTTLSFDIAALEIFLPITVGARLVIISRETASDGSLLAEKLAQCGATVMQATPATWRLLLEAGWQGSKQLTMLCGGESLPRELADSLRVKGSSLWNLYGPTETTIWSTLCRVDSKERRIFIGRPIANTQIYILDSHMQPVPIGVVGDLYIGGHGLARGYLNRPDLTEERFIPNPYSDELGARLYKTGDLARYSADGNIEFLGRIDGQVKIRGFRIELGEIENALGQAPGVRQAVVLAREDTLGEKRLVAYIVPDRQLFRPTDELRTYLNEKLPAYMVPSAYVVLERFPLTPNGKVDRGALPAPDASRPDLSGAFVAPRNSVEEVLAGVWADLLKLECVDVNDNFFHLGGHSLLAIRVISRVRQAFGIALPLSALFENPTVAGLAAQVDRLKVNGGPANETVNMLAEIESLSDEDAEQLILEGKSETSS